MSVPITAHSNDILLYRLRLLEMWKERNGPWATYRKLAECLYAADKISAVETLCKLLGATVFQQAPIESVESSVPGIYYIGFTENVFIEYCLKFFFLYAC